jgi:hypothetical protein
MIPLRFVQPPEFLSHSGYLLGVRALCGNSILIEKYLSYQNDDKLTRDVRIRLEELNILLRDYG